MSPSVDLHFEVTGRSDGPVVVLLHAIGTSMGMWDPQLAGIEPSYRVVRVDLRGHGDSPVPPGPYSLADLGTDVVAVLDRLGVVRASICGLSLGGMVGLWLAAHEPARIDRLVAACVTAHPAVPEAWLLRARAVRDGGSAAVSDLVIERWGYVDRSPAIGEHIREALAATPPEGYAGCCEAIATMDLRPDLPAITAPTLLLAGRDDPAAPPAAAVAMATSIPDARVEVVEGAAHLVNVECPAEVTTAILQHLGR